MRAVEEWTESVVAAEHSPVAVEKDQQNDAPVNKCTPHYNNLKGNVNLGNGSKTK